jgi:hypothetical protein
MHDPDAHSCVLFEVNATLLNFPLRGAVAKSLITGLFFNELHQLAHRSIALEMLYQISFKSNSI